MDDANVKLSKTELALVTDRDIILTKNNIIARVYAMFGELSTAFKELNENPSISLPAEVLAISPKIYKGEQYLGLPYVMLDYPRFYTREDVIGVRCFFWWGNFFSITLHVAGRFLALNKTAIGHWINNHKNEGWYIGVSTDAWQHHFESDNYLPLATFDDALENNYNEPGSFIKLAKKIPLQQWDDAMDFFRLEYAELMKIFTA